MKIKTILMSILAVSALASCNNDDESGAIEEKAPLVVTLPDLRFRLMPLKNRKQPDKLLLCTRMQWFIW